MKLNKQIIVALVIMIATSALYRVLPGRPYGFAPQIAIALFGGSLFATKKQYAFLLPILSMFISDLLYQVLFQLHLSPMQGFYEGQLLNYILIRLLLDYSMQIVLLVLLIPKHFHLVYLINTCFQLVLGGINYPYPKKCQSLDYKNLEPLIHKKLNQ